MAERPIILFGEPNKAKKGKRYGGPTKIHYPEHSRQVDLISPKMAALEHSVASLKQSSMGIEAEKTLVFEVIGSVVSFYNAVKNLGNNMEWIIDMPQDFDASDDFYEEKEDKKKGIFTRNDKKAIIGGKVYCVMSNARAMDEMLSLWKKYCKNPKDEIFSQNGKTGWRDVFKTLVNVSFWGYKQRVEETGILDAWREELHDDLLSNVTCELELFYRNDSVKRSRNEANLRDEILGLGGTIISSCVIPEINYHSVLAQIPRTIAEEIVLGNKEISIVTMDNIMFFRSVGQAVFITKDNSFNTDISIPPITEIIDEPVIALFDGLPQENHPFLQGRLIVDDPDGFTSGYVIEARKHGTSMASMVALGDLSKITHSATHKIYIRPIFKPTKWLNDDYKEQTPSDTLLVDKIHIAVKRLFESESVAPTIKVINLSIGLSSRLFDRAMSPLARLLDWLSFKYRVLFVVSAGNHSENFDIGMTFHEFTASDFEARDKAIINHIRMESRNHRLLSPAESFNALTVGSTFADESSFNENARQIMPCSDGIPSAYSAVGMGLNNAVKPDILYPGGRQWIKESISSDSKSNVFEWGYSETSKPGIASAAPNKVSSSGSRIMYTFGTSNSAALISHEASRCYDTLVDVFNSAGVSFPDQHVALLIKAMLVHGAEWGEATGKFSNAFNLKSRGDYSDIIHRYLGYGIPIVERAIECTKNRIALIGYGNLKIEEAHTYDLPLPFNFSSSKILRRLTATLAYFSPVVPQKQNYRAAQVWYSIENSKKNLEGSRVDADSKAAVRGSIQHEIFETNKTVVWDEDGSIQLKVNCRGDAVRDCKDSIPYAIMVSFEIKDAIDIDVYNKISERISLKVPV